MFLCEKKFSPQKKKKQQYLCILNSVKKIFSTIPIQSKTYCKSQTFILFLICFRQPEVHRRSKNLRVKQHNLTMFKSQTRTHTQPHRPMYIYMSDILSSYICDYHCLIAFQIEDNNLMQS